MAEATSKDSILADIRALNISHTVSHGQRVAALAGLRTVATKIISGLDDLSRNELIDVQSAFSQAFKPIGVKPEWATGLCRTIDRRVMAMSQERLPIASIPAAEYTPHPMPA